jgi:enoyl-[acyl-carrier protein] reductase III
MVDQFQGKVVLVTGSGRGIGREIALRFAREGADIAVNFFRNRQPAEDTVEEIRALGRKAVAIKANMGDIEDLNSLFDQIEDNFGRLDVLIHNAASGYNRPSLEQRPKGWDWTMNINARSLLFGAQRAAKIMHSKGGGKIVAISSLGSERVLPDYVVVGASKAALESLIRYLGVELAPMNIVVNAVSPGIVETKALNHFSAFVDAREQLVSEVASRTPTGRLCTPEDVANIVYFLCTPQANMICGQTIIVDGGYSLQAKT